VGPVNGADDRPVTAVASREHGDATLTRRALIAAGGAALAAAALADASRIAGLATQIASPGPRAASAPAAGGGPAQLRRSTFTGLIGDRFDLATANGRVTGRLIAVESARSSRVRGSQATPEETFGLVFHAERGPRLPDGIMTVSHAGLGAFSLFVSRSSAGRRGQEYAAIINRVRSR
jgi:hypothetical protein